MKETSGDSYKPINEQLYEHGSWLYREEGRKWSLSMFFDPDTEEFRGFPNVYKMLVLKELFQSGITPAMLDASYKANCKETHLDKPYQDYGLLLLELIKEIIVGSEGHRQQCPHELVSDRQVRPTGNHRTRGGAEDAGIFFIRLVRTVEKREVLGNQEADHPA